MAKAIGGDPLKKQKDSLNFKNTVIDRFKREARNLLKMAQEPSYVKGIKHLSNKYPHSKLLKRMAEVYKDSNDKAKKRKAYPGEHKSKLKSIGDTTGPMPPPTKEATGGLRATLTHKPKPKKLVPLPTYVPTRGVQLTPTPAPKAAKMSTPITNRLTPQSPANGKHPRKVKTREKVTRRGRTKTTKTKY